MIAEKSPSTALQEPVRSVAAVGADIIRPRNQLDFRLCDVTAEKFAIAALREPVNSVTAVGADIMSRETW